MLDLEPIKKRLAVASDGTWSLDEELSQVWSYTDVLNGDVIVGFCGDERIEDMRFIAESKQDIAALVAEVERLRNIMEVAYSQSIGAERSWPERAQKAATTLGIELGKCVCGIGNIASLSCPKHGLRSPSRV